MLRWNTEEENQITQKHACFDYAYVKLTAFYRGPLELDARVTENGSEQQQSLPCLTTNEPKP